MAPPNDAVRVQIRCDDEAAADRIRSVLSTLTGVIEANGALAHHSDTPLLVIGPDDEDSMLAAIELGAMGYVVVSATSDDIRAAAELVASGSAVIPPMMLGALLRHTVRRRHQLTGIQERLAVLTNRERQVIEQLARGEARSTIAHRLYISPATVRTHIQRAMAKLGVHSQNELMALLAPLDRSESP